VVTLGEVVAFGVPLLVLTAVARADLPDIVLASLAVMGGAVEGAVLGWFQVAVLGPHLGGSHGRSWIRATAIGAAVAWAAGMAPSQLRPVLEGRETFLLGLVMFLLLLVVLLSVGVAQWFVLRDLVDRATTWIWASAGAWFAGLSVAAPVWSQWQEGQGAGVRILIGVAGGLAMAATMAVVTGVVLRAMLRRPPPSWVNSY
jgi:hypothetical protein